MINKPQFSGKITCWVLLFQEFGFSIDVKAGKILANGNFLSSFSIEVNPYSIDQNSTNAHIINIEIIPTKYAHVLHYLTTNTFPLDYNEKQKQ